MPIGPTAAELNSALGAPRIGSAVRPDRRNGEQPPVAGQVVERVARRAPARIRFAEAGRHHARLGPRRLQILHVDRPPPAAVRGEREPAAVGRELRLDVVVVAGDERPRLAGRDRERPDVPAAAHAALREGQQRAVARPAARVLGRWRAVDGRRLTGRRPLPREQVAGAARVRRERDRLAVRRPDGIGGAARRVRQPDRRLALAEQPDVAPAGGAVGALDRDAVAPGRELRIAAQRRRFERAQLAAGEIEPRQARLPLAQPAVEEHAGFGQRQRRRHRLTVVAEDAALDRHDRPGRQQRHRIQRLRLQPAVADPGDHVAGPAPRSGRDRTGGCWCVTRAAPGRCRPSPWRRSRCDR